MKANESDSENDTEFNELDHGVMGLTVIICAVILFLAGSGIYFILYLLGLVN